jgi:hypothetical protein
MDSALASGVLDTVGLSPTGEGLSTDLEQLSELPCWGPMVPIVNGRDFVGLNLRLEGKNSSGK